MVELKYFICSAKGKKTVKDLEKRLKQQMLKDKSNRQMMDTDDISTVTADSSEFNLLFKSVNVTKKAVCLGLKFMMLFLLSRQDQRI